MANPLYDQLFGRHAGKDTPFLRLPGGQVLSHAEFLAITAQIAGALAEAGLQPGDRLAAQVEKSPEALALYAACTQTGVVFLPLNTDYTADELTYFIENSGAAIVVCDPAKAQRIAPIAQASRAQLETLDGAGHGTLMDKAAPMTRQFNTADRNEDDLAAFLYTSGTTGRSKGAMLTQANLLSNAKVLTEYWQFTSDDVLLHALPIFHTHGLFVATNVMLLAGGSMLFLPRFALDPVIEALPNATAMMGVPTFYTRLLDDPRFTHDRAAHMRLFISGSAPLLADTHTAFEARTGHRILERYGMTETNMNTSNPYSGDRRAGTVGLPLPGVEFKITDPATGDTLPKGSVGMIEVRGPNVFEGYWQMPDKTAEDLRPDGFFITGDLGVQDEDGYVSIVGRSKDLIISGGYNIYPKEIEAQIDTHPDVLESAVIGVPHPDFGETPLAIIVPAPGRTPDAQAVLETSVQSLARFKHPRDIIVLTSLPRNTMGKVQKAALRDTFKSRFTKL